MESLDSFRIKKSIIIDKNEYYYFSLESFFDKIGINSNLFPYSLKILLENILRNENNNDSSIEQIKKFSEIFKKNKRDFEIPFYPTRILMQDFTGVPAIADLASMRNALNNKNINPDLINPKIPVDLVIDHSVMVDSYGSDKSFKDIFIQL